MYDLDFVVAIPQIDQIKLISQMEEIMAHPHRMSLLNCRLDTPKLTTYPTLMRVALK